MAGYGTHDGKTKRDLLLRRWGALKQERATWDDHWREISEFLLPRQGRFFTQDRNKGMRNYGSIYDNTATWAHGVLVSGLMSGATSQARPWFKFRLRDKQLNAQPEVRRWLDEVRDIILSVLDASNTYDALPQLYSELVAFGTGASIVVDDYKNVIHHHVLTAGEYAIAKDQLGNITTLYREFDMTVANIVDEFGLDACSPSVQQQWKNGDLDTWRTIIHAIEPRKDRDLSKRDSKNMPWKSCYFEHGGNSNELLRESGHPQFPVLVPRWKVTSNDIYGESPAMVALGDIKGIQHKQVRIAECIDKQTDPPLQLPNSTKGDEINTQAGGSIYADQTSPSGGIRSLFDVSLNLGDMDNSLARDYQHIQRAFFTDLFLMFEGISADTQRTAVEVMARQEEKLLMLGPVLGRLNRELLRPLIDIVFDRLAANGGLPEPPQEIQDLNTDPEFISVLAQAQKAIGTRGIDKLLVMVGSVAEAKPEALDKVNIDKLIDLYADMLGVPPEVIETDERVMSIRDARNKANAAKEQALLIEQMSGAANDLANSPTNEQNALTDSTRQFAGYT